MPKIVNIANQRFGRLVAIETSKNEKNQLVWKCKCDCGSICYKRSGDLRAGKVSSCGCLKKELISERNKKNYIDLKGQRFGKLLVIEKVESFNQHAGWKCLCDCGNFTIADSGALKSGDKVSCGCQRGSIVENIIAKILKDNNILFKREYTFNNLKGENGKSAYRFDFAIFNQENKLERLIEYHGEQHYLDKGDNIVWKDSLKKRQFNDNVKRQYCKKHCIPLVVLPYSIKNEITLDILLGDKYLIF